MHSIVSGVTHCVMLVCQDIVINWIDSQSNRSGKTSRALSGATSTEDPTALGADCTTHPVSGNLPISMANLASSGSHEGSLKGKGAKATTRWSGLFGSTYKVGHEHVCYFWLFLLLFHCHVHIGNLSVIIIEPSNITIMNISFRTQKWTYSLINWMITAGTVYRDYLISWLSRRTRIRKRHSTGKGNCAGITSSTKNDGSCWIRINHDLLLMYLWHS